MKNWLQSKTIWVNLVLLAVGAYMTYAGVDMTGTLAIGAGLANIALRFKTGEAITFKQVVDAVEEVKDLLDGEEEEVKK